MVISSLKALNSSIPTLLTIIFANFYSPPEFVCITIFLVISSIFQACEQSASLSIAKFYSDKNAKVLDPEVLSVIQFMLIIFFFIATILFVIIQLNFEILTEYTKIFFSYQNITLITLTVFARLANFLPRGIIIGKMQHIRLTIFDTIAVLITFMGIFLFQRTPDVSTYFHWTAITSVCISAIYYLLTLTEFKQILLLLLTNKIQSRPINFMALMIITSLITSIFGGMDRLLLANSVDADTFYLYTICFTLSSMLLLGASPIIQILIPEAKILVLEGKIHVVFHNFTQYLSLIFVVYLSFILSFSSELFYYLFGFVSVNTDHIYLLSLLTLNFYFSAMSYPFHAIQLANGRLLYSLISTTIILGILTVILGTNLVNSIIGLGIMLAILNLGNLIVSVLYTSVMVLRESLSIILLKVIIRLGIMIFITSINVIILQSLSNIEYFHKIFLVIFTLVLYAAVTSIIRMKI